MAKLKVAVAITLPELGGAQSHVEALLAGLDRDRFEPVLLTGGRGWLTERAEALGLRVHALRFLRRPIRPWTDALALVELVHVLRREKPDVLHLHSSKAGLLGRIAGRLAPVPRVVFTAHGFSFHERLHPLPMAAFAALEYLLLPLADVVVPVSEYDRKRGINFGLEADKLLVVPNGVDTAAFAGHDRAAARSALGASEGTVVVGMVARQAFPKDHPLFLRAVQPLLAEHPGLVVALIGGGRDEPANRALAEQLGIAGRVRFLGDREDVPALLAGLDVFVLASKFEALPVSILEAMAAGLPVVASDVGGVRELVADGETGFVVEKDAEAPLTAAIGRLVGSAKLRARLGAAGRARAVDRFDRTGMVQALEGVYAAGPLAAGESTAAV